MSDECPRCGTPADRHGPFCEREDVFRGLFKDSTPAVYNQAPPEVVPVAPRKEPVLRDAAMDFWDLEEEPSESREYAVKSRRKGSARSIVKYFQRVHFAKRRFQRLLKSSGRGGLAPVVELELLSRQVGPWELERDVPWLRR